MTTDIIKQRHDAYHTSEQIIFDLVKRATGQGATAREKIVRGYDEAAPMIAGLRESLNKIVPRAKD